MTTLPSTTTIPDKLINAKVYDDGDELLGVAEVTLPELSYVSEAISGLGIAGEVETPVIGHFSSLTISFSWNSISSQNTRLLNTNGQQLTVYASLQSYDAGLNKLTPKPAKLMVNTQPKKIGLGKAVPGQKMDSDTELEVMSMQLWVGGSEVVHIDKFNFICRINGEDMLAEIKSHLGA